MSHNRGAQTGRALAVFSAGVLLLYAVLVLLPLAVVFGQSVWHDGRITLEPYQSVLAHPRQWSLLRNTLVIAAGTSLLATLLGAPVGFALGYLRVPGRRVLAYATALPLLVPPYIAAIVWADLLGRHGWLRFGLNLVLEDASSPLPLYSTAGTVFVLALSYYPVVAFATLLGLRRYDVRLEEPARLIASPIRAFRAVTWPLLAPSVLAGSVAVFVLGLVEFSVPSFLQVNIYAVEIYERFSVSYDVNEAAAQAVPLLVCGALAWGAWTLLAHRREGLLSGASRSLTEKRDHDLIARFAAVACGFLVAVTSLLPMALLFYRSLPLTSYVEVWRTAREELGTSLTTAAGSATLLTCLATAMACLVRWRRSTSGLYAFGFLGFLVTGPLLGVALITVWNRPGPPAWIYDSAAILVVACSARFLFFAYEGLFAAQNALSRRLDEAAAVCGVSAGRQATGILLPLLSPAMVAVWGLSFLFAFRELDAAVLVAPPGYSTIAVRLFGLMHYGPSRFVAALSVITVAVILAGALATGGAYACLRRLLHARG